MHFSLAERRRKEKEKKKREKKRPSSNGSVTHAVRLRAYAISPCLRLPHCFSFFLALFLSPSLPPSFADALPFRWPFGHFPPLSRRSYSPLFTIFLFGSGESLGIVESRPLWPRAPGRVALGGRTELSRRVFPSVALARARACSAPLPRPYQE